jgi:hypothetical protein
MNDDFWKNNADIKNQIINLVDSISEEINFPIKEFRGGFGNKNSSIKKNKIHFDQDPVEWTMAKSIFLTLLKINEVLANSGYKLRIDSEIGMLMSLEENIGVLSTQAGLINHLKENNLIAANCHYSLNNGNYDFLSIIKNEMQLSHPTSIYVKIKLPLPWKIV